MTHTISGMLISSDQMDYSAEPWPVPESEEAPPLWRVSWLPDQYLDHNQAITAMLLAEVVSVGLEPGVGRRTGSEGPRGRCSHIQTGAEAWPSSSNCHDFGTEPRENP